MSLPSTVIPFGEWLPDLAAHENPGLVQAKNAIPEANSYRDFKALQTFSAPISGDALAAFWLQDSTNAVLNFAASADTLNRLDGGVTWTDVSKTGAAYGADSWEFTRFGQRVLAATSSDVVQTYDLDSSTEFEDLTNAPRGRRIATVRDFVVLGDTLDADGTNTSGFTGPNFVRWCGANRTDLWTPSRASQADFQELFGRGGRVQKVVPGEYGLIFQEHSITRMDYVGPPVIFQFDELERQRGTPAPGSVVWTGERVFFYSNDGFYVHDGRSSTPISANRISQWFRNTADASAIKNMQGAIDRQNRLVLWAFKSNMSTSMNDKIIIYNWSTDRWSCADVDTQLLVDYASSGIGLDDLDALLPDGVDTSGISLDGDLFKGGSINVAAFSAQARLGLFDGTPLEACIEPGDFGSPDESFMLVNGVRPLVEGGSDTAITVQPGKRRTLQEPVVYSPPRALNIYTDEATFKVRAKYHRMRVSISGGFSHARGMRVTYKQGKGRR